jgi:hypothetical protein
MSLIHTMALANPAIRLHKNAMINYKPVASLKPKKESLEIAPVSCEVSEKGGSSEANATQVGQPRSAGQTQPVPEGSRGVD